MPLSDFFTGAQRFAGQALGQAQQGYQQLDKTLGGWLPGGGTASPLTAWQQDQARKQAAEQARVRATPPYVGKPGERSGQTGFSNAMDVLNRAGASPFGFITENPNDLALVKNYFTKNPDVMNQYDLPTNMFLRYYTGVGAKGMKLSPEQGQEILKGIGVAKGTLDNPTKRQQYFSNLQQFNNPAYAASYKQKIESGMIPVNTPESLPPGGEINYSLGRHWATPLPQGGYQIDEKFDWGYAPKNKGGTGEAGQTAIQQQLAQQPSWQAALQGPAALAQNLVTKGYGNPFAYRLLVSPTGAVQTQPLPNNQ